MDYFSVFTQMLQAKGLTDNTIRSYKTYIKQMAQFIIYGKDTMAMRAVNKFKGHRGRAFLRVFHAAGRTEPALTAERNELHVAAVRADIHGAPKKKDHHNESS